MSQQVRFGLSKKKMKTHDAHNTAFVYYYLLFDQTIWLRKKIKISAFAVINAGISQFPGS
jgi:hypothetical protein